MDAESVRRLTDDDRRSLDSGLARGVLWTGGVKWMIQLVSWPVTILTAKLLDPRDYGYLALVSVITRFVQMLTEAGLGAAIVNGLTLEEDQIRQLNTVSVISGVLGFLCVLVLSLPASIMYKDPGLQPVLMVLAVSLILEGIALVPTATLRKRLDFRRLAIAEGSRNMVDIGLTLLLAYLGAQYWSLVGGYLAGVATWLLFVRVFNPVPFARPRRARLSEVIGFSRLLIGRNVSSFVAFGSDAAIGGLSMSKAALGHYSFAGTIAYAPADKITQIILRVVPAILGNVRESQAEVARYFLAITSVVTLVSLPMITGIGIVASDLVPVLLGPQWVGLIPVIIPFCVYGVVSEIVAVVPHVLQTLGEARTLARNGFVALVVMPVSFLVLSRFYEASGLAAAWAVGSTILAVYPLKVALKRTEVAPSQFFASIRTPLIGCAIMLALLLFLRQTTTARELSTMARLVFTCLLGAVTYTAVVAALDAKRLRSLLALSRQLRRGH